MIICCGEALTDMVPNETPNQYDAHIGGALLNVTIACAAQGEPAALLSNVSTDQFGNNIMEYAKLHQVDLGLLDRSDHPSGIVFASLDQNGDAQYSYYGYDSAETNFDYQAYDKTKLEKANILHFGSFSFVKGKSAESFQALMKDQHKNKLISLDLNVRPTIEKDLEKWREAFKAYLKYAHIVKLSMEDLMLIYGDKEYDDVALNEILADWQNQGVTLSIITCGADGVIARYKEDMVQMPSQKLDIKDTIGAGDSFMGGLLASLHRKNIHNKQSLNKIALSEIEVHINQAMENAAYTVQQQGAKFPKKID